MIPIMRRVEALSEAKRPHEGLPPADCRNCVALPPKFVFTKLSPLLHPHIYGILQRSAYSTPFMALIYVADGMPTRSLYIRPPYMDGQNCIGAGIGSVDHPVICILEQAK